MKKLIYVLLALTFTTTWAQKYSKIKGNGNIITSTITTEAYESIEVTGSLEIKLIAGQEGTIAVTTDDNIQEYVKVTNNNGILNIKLEDGYYLKPKNSILVTVPVISVNGVSLVGSGEIVGDLSIKSEDFNVKLTGSGEITLDINATNTKVSLVGSGDITLNGETLNLKANLTGSGEINAHKFKAQITKVTVSGSGDASVYASQSIEATVNGSGSIDYNGNPKQTSLSENGSGSIKG